MDIPEEDKKVLHLALFGFGNRILKKYWVNF